MVSAVLRSRAVALGLLGDLIVGEPPVTPHPVAAFGQVMKWVESHLYGDTRLRGLLHTCIGVGVGVTAGRLLCSTASATYLAAAPRGLAEAARDVHVALSRDDLEGARQQLPALVGRDPSGLDSDEIARAVVESVAENTVDAIVAPACWALVGGSAGALAYRAINTMDASVGHRSERYVRYGWASARLDDVANYVPARLTALLVAMVRPGAARSIWRAVRNDAPSHPSPNAGVAEAAFAAALGLRLGGVNTYGGELERRPDLGAGRIAHPDDIAAAIALSTEVTLLLIALLEVGGRSA
jgi:adenosylcobinamide-phosphate synthase